MRSGRAGSKSSTAPGRLIATAPAGATGSCPINTVPRPTWRIGDRSVPIDAHPRFLVTYPDARPGSGRSASREARRYPRICRCPRWTGPHGHPAPTSSPGIRDADHAPRRNPRRSPSHLRATHTTPQRAHLRSSCSCSRDDSTGFLPVRSSMTDGHTSWTCPPESRHNAPVGGVFW